MQVKSFLNKVRNIIFVIIFALFIAGTIIFLGLFLYRTKQFNDLNNNLSNTQNNSSSANVDNQTKIATLQQNLTEANHKIETLQQDNQNFKSQIDQYSKDGYGEINGKISGQIILSNSNISQFQQVCAQNTGDTSLQYCLNVSSITQTYKMFLPMGTYQVYAQGLDKDNKNILQNYKGYYTQYIQCLNNKTANITCDNKLSKNIVSVEVKAGSKISDVNPIDWSTL